MFIMVIVILVVLVKCEIRKMLILIEMLKAVRIFVRMMKLTGQIDLVRQIVEQMLQVILLLIVVLQHLLMQLIDVHKVILHVIQSELSVYVRLNLNKSYLNFCKI
jgi:hypothetical protein